MSRRFGIALAVALLLPCATPIMMMWQAEREIASAERFRIPIIGFDPRDMLRGHYILFDYDWNWETTPDRPANPKQTLICLNRVGGLEQAPLASLNDKPCDAKVSGWLHPGFAGGRLMATFRPAAQDNSSPELRVPRIFVNEKHAKPLEDILRDSRAHVTVEIAVTTDHKAKVLALYINGQKPADYFRARQ